MFDGRKLSECEFMRDPSRLIAGLRNTGDVVETSLPIIGRVWLVVSHEFAGQMLKQNVDFTIRRDGKVTGLQWWMPGIFRVLAKNMLTVDEPDHKRLRSIVDETFRRRAILEMEPHIDEIAMRLANNLFDERETADLVERFARQLPLAVICEILGLPAEDRPQFTRWANGLARTKGIVGFIRLVPGLWAMKRYLETRISAAQKGGTGLIAELVLAQAEGARISDEELVAMVFLLLVAGHETTTHLISGAIYTLLERPEKRDWLIADWDRAPLAVEEFLRFVSPVQFSKPRFVARDMQFGGASLKRGDKVMAMLAAANMDPAAFDDPTHLDMTRRANHHISFGTGIHFCLGHQLARIELKSALRALFSRWPQVELACRPNEVRWRERIGLRSIERLPVRPGDPLRN